MTPQQQHQMLSSLSMSPAMQHMMAVNQAQQQQQHHAQMQQMGSMSNMMVPNIMVVPESGPPQAGPL
jgi:1,4-dihydroxy-2-naphthoate octaprenyltransferase